MVATNRLINRVNRDNFLLECNVLPIHGIITDNEFMQIR